MAGTTGSGWSPPPTGRRPAPTTLYQRCRRVADEHGTGLITHVLETRAEMLFNLQAHGKPAVRRLADLGVLTPETVLEHFVWVTDDELAVFADSGAVASNNPGSNLRLSTGICRVRDIMDAGGRIAFGTDGISFSDRDDFFTELRLACYLQRLPPRVRAGPPGQRAACCARPPETAPGRSAWRAGWAAWSPAATPTCSSWRKDRIFFPPGRYDAEPFLDVVLDRADCRRHRHGDGRTAGC